MALANLSGWNKEKSVSAVVGTACGASDPKAACGASDPKAACGASDPKAACGASDK